MTKIAKKRKVNVGAPLKRRLTAAICLLLVSAVMLVTTTYAWYTISTAPEAKEIGTAVSGNGSLEVALMPSEGNISGITSARGDSGYYGGGNKAITASNITWGNLVSLMDPSYGLDKITLKPIGMQINDTTGAISFQTPTFGYDGRIVEANAGEGNLKSYSTADEKFNGTAYGVRAITETAGNEPFGFAIDLAFRMNASKADGTAGKLQLQGNEELQRISGGTTDSTLGQGSYVEITAGAGNLSSGFRIVFIQNFGVADENAEKTVLATAKLANPTENRDENNVLISTTYDLALENAEGGPIANSVLLDAMEKNTAYQISAVVFIDGVNATNADFAYAGDAKININLQFKTDISLTPVSVQDELGESKGKPIIGTALAALADKFATVSAAKALLGNNAPEAVDNFIAKYNEVNTKYAVTENNEYDAYTMEQGYELRAELE
ncbi:MAG: hypothetical protein II135_07500, partial [Clostridia bacterium]|nr:hypothetical protein [Clostridia bacterium]